MVSVGELEEKLVVARKLLRRDVDKALSLIKEIASEAIKIAAPGWDPQCQCLAEYSSSRKMPDFFREMADRIEWSWRFVMEAKEFDALMALSSTAFLVEVVRRLK